MENKFTGVIISKKEVGEADRLYTIYTKEKGIIKAKAVGVRKPRARLAGSLENFLLADISVVKKSGVGRITASIVENNFSRIRGNIDAITSVFQAMKIFEKLLALEEKDEKIFSLLIDYLQSMEKEALKEEGNFEVISHAFIFKLLEILGYKIEASRCVMCRSRLEKSGNSFSPEAGGILCFNCAPGRVNATDISENAIKLIRLFQANSPGLLSKVKSGKKESKELEKIIANFLIWINS
jgi:DNA repair protein RecO (recombination protein O)